MDQTLRIWVKTLNPSWRDPSPYHNLHALKVPVLRASLGITGPPLIGFPPPCHLGNCGMNNQGWHNAKCIFLCYILDGHAHYMNAPCKHSTNDWGSSLVKVWWIPAEVWWILAEVWWIPVDCTESGCNELHNMPQDNLGLEENCNLKMCILASPRHAQNTEDLSNAQRRIRSSTLRGFWLHPRKRQCISCDLV